MGYRYSNMEGRRGGRGRFRGENEERFGPGRGDYGRSEPYFGGGHQQFGSGMPESQSFGPTSSSWRENEGFGPGNRPYNPGEGFGGSRGDYGQGYQYRNSPGRMGSRYGGRQNFGGTYGSSFPESESGYYGNQEDRGWWDKTTDEVSSWFGDEEAERRREMDSARGDYRGRGPKNYRRSDERIQEDVNDRLTDHDFLDASNIDVEVSNGEVTLSGMVDTRYQKRLAEDIAEDVSGVSNVENRLRVESSAYHHGPFTDTTDTTRMDTQSRSASENR